MQNLIENIQDAVLPKRERLKSVYDEASGYVAETWQSGNNEAMVPLGFLRAVMRALEIGHDELEGPSLESSSFVKMQGEFYRDADGYWVRLEVPNLFRESFDIDTVLADRIWGLFVYYVIAEMRKHPFFWHVDDGLLTISDWIKRVIDHHFSLNDAVPDFTISAGKVHFNVETAGDPVAEIAD